MSQILLPNSIIDELRQSIQASRTGNEQGGLLLGFRKKDALQITSYTLPQKWDYATPFLFKRSMRGHSGIAYLQWQRSKKTVDWLGEWHTHPGGAADPSIADKQSWLRLVRHTRNSMTFLILSDHAMYVGLQAMLPAGLRQLEPIEQDDKAMLLG